MSHTVLVVEDEEDLRELMRDALELNGYAVVTADHGGDALAKLSGIDHLCLIILDLLMPVMNGWDFVDSIRKRSDLATVPIVVHSSASGPAPRGVTRMLQKPMALESLLTIVREFCPG